MAQVAIRQRVPRDNSCLFRAVAYLAEGEGDQGHDVAQRLREICALDALQDPDPAMRALLVGRDTVEDYGQWIMDDRHWGGEQEILVLARHYCLEIVVVCCRSVKTLCYGSTEGCLGRIYVLYTGQHYDPIIAGSANDVAPSLEQRRFPKCDQSLEAEVIELARAHNADALLREAATAVAAQRLAEELSMVGRAAASCTHCGGQLRPGGGDHICNGYHKKSSMFVTPLGRMF